MAKSMAINTDKTVMISTDARVDIKKRLTKLSLSQACLSIGGITPFSASLHMGVCSILVLLFEISENIDS